MIRRKHIHRRKHIYAVTSDELRTGDPVVMKEDGTVGLPKELKEKRDKERELLLLVQEKLRNQNG